ncbi:MAG: succinate dehydrogenase/fumarate reductase iron-sulfur subunit [Planctomycetota bacterium]
MFHIFRYNADDSAAPKFDTYELDAEPGTTVLGALLALQQQQDSSLTFRFSCRSAVCGSCGMTINGKCDLACRTQLFLLPTNEIIVEPLPNLDVIRDLVVDMIPFWDKYLRIRPWLHSQDAETSEVQSESPTCEKTQSPKQFRRIEQYTNCILCACCYGACPVLKRQPDYLGPAALAKLLRFVDDSRDRRSAEQLDEVDNDDGLWGCDTVYRCIDVCPKDVRPTDGIAALRRRLVMYRIRKGLRRGQPEHVVDR